jgi:serine acetyltransferase
LTLVQGATFRHGRGGAQALDDEVALAPGVVLVGAHHVGKGTTVGANSVVKCDTPVHEMWVEFRADFSESSDNAMRHDVQCDAK